LAGGVYFPTFYYIIKKMNVQTPGREVVTSNSSSSHSSNSASKTEKDQSAATSKKEAATNGQSKYAKMAAEVIAAIGADNFVSVDNCATRLRLILKDNSKVDDARIKAAGAFGVRRLGSEAFQIVIGADVEHVANEVKKQLNK
jgi:PTS system N-acetylglucosamine-specific IIC component